MSSLFLTQHDGQSQTHRIRANARRLDLYLRNKMSDRSFYKRLLVFPEKLIKQRANLAIISFSWILKSQER